MIRSSRMAGICAPPRSQMSTACIAWPVSPSSTVYLFDGTAPERDAIADGIARAMADAARTRLSLWILQSPRLPYGGCVQLRPDLSAKSAELIYLLDPTHWGRGLATRMGWTAITMPFWSPSTSLSPEPMAPTGLRSP